MSFKSVSLLPWFWAAVWQVRTAEGCPSSCYWAVVQFVSDSRGWRRGWQTWAVLHCSAGRIGATETSEYQCWGIKLSLAAEQQ